jgi:spermidine synthase
MKMDLAKRVDQVPISKLGLAHYMRNYDEFLGPLRDQPLKLLELGIAEGDSLRKWAEWMPRASIVGLDIRPRIAGLDSERIATYQGEQQDRLLLDRIGREQAPEGFDVIIDDASHIGQLTRLSFWHLYQNHLKPGGFYFIEDWGTGYWPQSSMAPSTTRPSRTSCRASAG